MKARRAAVFAFLLLTVGCAGAGFNVPAFQDDVARGRFAAALEDLGSAGGRNDVARLLDQGLLLGALGRYDESNAVFQSAETRIEDLYTRSLGKEAAALLTSDLALDYRPPPFEVAIIPYYRAWNYLQQGRVEDVLVEARKINERLKFLSASCSGGKGDCDSFPFLRYFSGLLFEWAGETNDAYVSYKQADTAWENVRRESGVEPPEDLAVRLVRTALRLGFVEEARGYADKYGVPREGIGSDDTGSIVVVFENGMIGWREESSLTVPIFQGETDEIAADVDGWSRALARRAYATPGDAKLEYLLRVALPRFVDRSPAAAFAEVVVDSVRGRTRIAALLSARAQAALDRAMGGILVRAVARALTKYLAHRTAKKEWGGLAGVAVNLLGAVTERVDTRSWRSLPHEIQVASVRVPAGDYSARLAVRSPDGSILARETYERIHVPPGGVALIRHRFGL